MKFLPLAFCVLGVCGCATRQPDHFYVLDAQPAAATESRTQFDRQITLRVTVPSLLDRAEMVLTAPSGVTVLDHARWAAPLADLVTATLGRDIERRHVNAVVLPRSEDQAGIPVVRMAIEIDGMTARLDAPVAVETHWRVTDTRTGKVSVGRDSFVSTQRPKDYAELANALSSCIALLADRLVLEIPRN